MKDYTHLFFDLDHTLWDYEKNSEKTLKLLCREYQLDQSENFNMEEFVGRFTSINEYLWDQYHSGKIDQSYIRSERFKKVFSELQIDCKYTEDFSQSYINQCPKMGHTIPGAIELLEDLKERYELHIITNGFVGIQHIKLSTSGLDSFFGEVIISGHTPYRKPDARIFNHALKLTNGKAETSAMIGDSLESDILGAKSVPMDQVYFNPKKKSHDVEVTFEISQLSEMTDHGF